MAMSDEWDVHKPQPEFLRASARADGQPEPADVAYVGDRLDNDVRPSAAAGMRAVWLRRGPWGVIAGRRGADGHAGGRLAGGAGRAHRRAGGT